MLQVSANIPNDGVQFSPSVPKELRDKIVDALLAIIKTRRGQGGHQHRLPVDRAGEARRRFYDAFRQVLQAAGVTADVLMPKK